MFKPIKVKKLSENEYDVKIAWWYYAYIYIANLFGYTPELSIDMTEIE